MFQAVESGADIGVGAIEVKFEQHEDDNVIIPDAIAFPLVCSAHLLLVSSVFAFVKEQWVFGSFLSIVYMTSVWHWSKPRFDAYARYFDYAAVQCCVASGLYVAFTEGDNMPAWTVPFLTVLFCFMVVIFVSNETMYYLQLMRHPTAPVVDRKGKSESKRLIKGSGSGNRTDIINHSHQVSSTCIDIEDGHNPSATTTTTTTATPTAAAAAITINSTTPPTATSASDVESEADADVVINILGCVDVIISRPKKNTKERDYVFRRVVYVHLFCVHIVGNTLALILTLTV